MRGNPGAPVKLFTFAGTSMIASLSRTNARHLWPSSPHGHDFVMDHGTAWKPHLPLPLQTQTQAKHPCYALVRPCFKLISGGGTQACYSCWSTCLPDHARRRLPGPPACLQQNIGVALGLHTGLVPYATLSTCSMPGGIMGRIHATLPLSLQMYQRTERRREHPIRPHTAGASIVFNIAVPCA